MTFVSSEMPFFSNWDEFAKAVEMLYAASRNRCRFVTKYSNELGELNLKVTDDCVCLRYSSKSVQDVKRLEKLTNSLMRQMTARDVK
ncbi:hypothetical protein D918_01230 [Trichuris suis]|nr:hypothetical protein D918_01230 [Trichuris suis]